MTHLRTQEIELDFGIAIGDEYHELDGMTAIAVYEVEGADEPATYDYPGYRAAWILHELLVHGQEQIDDYNKASREAGYPTLPFKSGDDIFRYLGPDQVRRIERDLEDSDREPDYPDYDPNEGYDIDDGYGYYY